MDECLKGAIFNPPLQPLLVFLGIDVTHSVIADDEAAHRQALDEDVVNVLER